MSATWSGSILLIHIESVAKSLDIMKRSYTIHYSWSIHDCICPTILVSSIERALSWYIVAHGMIFWCLWYILNLDCKSIINVCRSTHMTGYNTAWRQRNVIFIQISLERYHLCSYVFIQMGYRGATVYFTVNHVAMQINMVENSYNQIIALDNQMFRADIQLHTNRTPCMIHMNMMKTDQQTVPKRGRDALYMEQVILPWNTYVEACAAVEFGTRLSRHGHRPFGLMSYTYFDLWNFT